MTFITLISLILFFIILITRIILKHRNKKKLDNIRGFGGIFKKGNEKGNLVGGTQNK